MIDVRVNPATVPVPIESGQQKPAQDFRRFLESNARERGSEAADAARLQYGDAPGHAPILPVLNGEFGKPEGMVAEGECAGVIEVAMDDTVAGAHSPDLWLVVDAGTVTPSIKTVAVEARFAEQEAGYEKGSDGSFAGSGALVSIQDASQMQMRTGPECEEWVLRPWRLQAGTGLSYRSGNSLPFQMDGNTFAAAIDGLSACEGKAPSIGSAGERVWPVLQENLPVVPAHGGAMLLIAGNGADGADSYAQAVIGSWNKGAWVHWAQRLLRWNAGATESENATAWVRDFSLGADEVPSLVASLRAFSAGQGISLGRIVVNGREAWAAAGYSQHMERKGDGR